MIALEISEQSARTFWSRVDKRGSDDCWLWTGRRNKRGYGQFGCHWKRSAYAAHRVSWFLAHGRQPVGFVCHRCDNPPCVNPAHLWLGTNADNNRDMIAKGRHWQASVTHCPHGHEYTEQNTHRYLGGRYCRACNRAAVKRRKARLFGSEPVISKISNRIAR